MAISPSYLKETDVEKLAPAQPHPFVAKGRPVSAAIHLPPELADVHYALVAQDRVHGDGELVNIAVKSIKSKGRGKKAIIGNYRVGDRPELDLAPDGLTPGLTLLHEIGHALQDQVIAKINPLYENHRTKVEELVWSQNMEGIGEAIRGTDEFKFLKSCQENARQNKFFRAIEIHKHPNREKRILQYSIDQKWVDYLLTDRELFARSYAQYVAIRSGDGQLLRELAAQRHFKKTTAVGGPNAKNDLHYFEHWDPKTFAPIATEFDKLLLQLDWIERV